MDKVQARVIGWQGKESTTPGPGEKGYMDFQRESVAKWVANGRMSQVLGDRILAASEVVDRCFREGRQADMPDELEALTKAWPPLD